ncbi:hypothetical protein HPG69_005700 [Diceros bicornis minor]|uniref:Uncharacterized protein n=1 Tax=Diceros bicornis minor TaxID=77932 RepID=A0A7J7ES61_DICBM|nr:hypothetical protein HPG69_005700 [Diceros bicornis minor]
MPTLILLRHYHYCCVDILNHSLPSFGVNSICRLSVVIITLGTDSVLILLSYAPILHAVLGIASHEE